MGSDGNYTKQPSQSDSLAGGNRTVTTAGVRVQLSTTSVPCIDLLIQAKRTNTGRIYIGGALVAADTNGIFIVAGASMGLSVTNLNQVYLDTSVNAEGVTYIYTATVG